MVSLMASATRGSFMLSYLRKFLQVVQNILVFGYSLGYGVSSAANLVKNAGITSQDCFLCRPQW